MVRIEVGEEVLAFDLDMNQILAQDCKIHVNAQSRRIAECDLTFTHRVDRATAQGAQRIGIGINLQQPITTHRSQHMGRCQQADASTQIVRAISPPCLANAPGHWQAARNTAPLGQVRLHYLQCALGQRLIKGLIARQVFAAS